MEKSLHHFDGGFYILTHSKDTGHLNEWIFWLALLNHFSVTKMQLYIHDLSAHQISLSHKKLFKN